MKLNKFIKELEKISRRVNRPDKIGIEMADCVSVVKPILKNGTVYITDISPRVFERENRIMSNKEKGQY